VEQVEQVVLLDELGHAMGAADKSTVHHDSTPLHLAFSAYVFDVQDRFLLTRRALGKRTWPGVWTNSCCGHPGPGEGMRDTVARRLRDELGLDAVSIDLVLPRFRYRAVMPDGVVENEMCPVYRVTVTGEPRPDPAEVMDYQWIEWQNLLASDRPISPWATEQLAELTTLGPDPRAWPTATPADLPPAAR
jgi:isopentenyl-diphosphate delta-isomerase